MEEVLEQVDGVTPPTNVGGGRAKGILCFKNLVDCFYRYTLAYDREMSHFIALAASYIHSWAVPSSKGMLAVAITTVPATRLQGFLLESRWFLCSVS